MFTNSTYLAYNGVLKIFSDIMFDKLFHCIKRSLSFVWDAFLSVDVEDVARHRFQIRVDVIEDTRGLDVFLALAISVQLDGHTCDGAVVGQPLEVGFGSCAAATVTALNHDKDWLTTKLSNHIPRVRKIGTLKISDRMFQISHFVLIKKVFGDERLLEPLLEPLLGEN